MAFQEVSRTPVYLQVADQIREAIFRGDLAPGETLPPERELATTFGVSRPSVREALRALQAQGLLVGDGLSARPAVAEGVTGPARESLANLLRLNQVEIIDLVEVRCALEAGGVQAAARAATPERLAPARAVLERMRGGDIDVLTFHDLDVQFHLALAQASGNEALVLLMTVLAAAVTRHLRETLEAEGDQRAMTRRLTREHAEILEAVAGGDGDHAAALVQDHIRRFYRVSLDRAPPPAAA